MINPAPHTRGLRAAALLIAITPAAHAADQPDANADTAATADPRQAPTAWVHAVGVTPVGEHQRHIIGSFVGVDLDMNGMLNIDEYRELVRQRTDYMFDRAAGTAGVEVGPREDLTAYAMADLEEDFRRADRDHDAGLTIHEVYYFETFDRPGRFPPPAESVPQAVAGDWEQLTVDQHAPVYRTPPFSPARHREATQAGGFTAVDGNGDGAVSLFEASDYSLLSWTPAIHAFAHADKNTDGRLGQTEFADFQEVVADFPPRAERPGRFPSDGNAL